MISNRLDPIDDDTAMSPLHWRTTRMLQTSEGKDVTVAMITKPKT